MNAHSKHSAQASISLYSMRGKSWSFYQKHISNLIDFDLDNSTVMPSRSTADVQRLDLRDCNLYGVSPSDPGPMVLCNQCNHIMAPEGIMRHVKRVHGSKIVPSPSIKLRIPAKGSSTAGSILSNTATSNISRMTNSSNSTVTSQTAAYVSAAAAAAESSLSSEFTNRLNVSNMAPPTPINASLDIANSINSSSSNSSSPISLSKIGSTSASSALGSSSINSSRSKNRKVLPVKDREYDPEKHCGVRIGNTKPCTRSLTCKTHQISLRRNVEGRSKPFDQLLADHRNNAKETHKHSSSKQTNYLVGDNSNQQILDTIGDSNSSSSFDMERRSFSSNSNQSAIGNYNSDHSTAFSTSSTQQYNGTQSSSVLSSIASATTTTANTNASTLNFTYAGGNSTSSAIGTTTVATTSTSATAVTHRKSGLTTVIPFTPSPDDRSNNASQLGDLYNSSTLSAMQSSAHNASNMSSTNHLNSTALNASATLASLNDYSMQMNDLINDDNGDGLDMTFWENFENFNYDADLVISNNNSNSNSNSNSSTAQQYSQLLSKSSSKRSHDGANSERKRKRGINDALAKDSLILSKSIPKDLLATKNGGSNLLSASPIPIDGVSTKSTMNMSQMKKSTLNANGLASTIVPSHSSIAIDSTTSKSEVISGEVICIEDDEDDATNNNNTDATVNRNSDRENGTIYPVTPTKELNSDYGTTKHHMGRSRHRSDSITVNGTQSPPLSIDKPLATMTLSTDTIVNPTDIINVTKILSEVDHQGGGVMPPTNHLNDTGELNGGTKSQPSQLASVPLGENENFLLDMVYKCLRGKGVRVINSNYSNNKNINGNISNISGTTTLNKNTNDSNRIREKENAIENHWSDDEILAEPVKIPANNPIMPTIQRFSSSKFAYVPRAIASNHFNMARGRGTCHCKHTVDYTKKIQQQIFHRIQTQQHNGTFTNANMITLRNNGLLRLNSAMNLGTITTASISTGTNSSVNTIKTTVAATTAGTGSNTPPPPASSPGVVASAVTTTPTNLPPTSIATVINANNNNGGSNSTNVNANPNASPTTTNATTANATIATGTAAGTKLAGFKKPVHFVNSIATTTNGPIVLLNPGPGNAGTMSTAPGNQRYAILRRPMAQSSIQFIARPTIDPIIGDSLMPAIHRVRTRGFKPTTPTLLETDRLLETLKGIIRPQALNSNIFKTTKKVLSVYNQSLNKMSANQQPNNTISTSLSSSSLLSSSSSSSKRKSSHSSSLSNHKSSTNATSSSQKQNGHSHSSNGAQTSGSNYIASNTSTSHNSSNNTNNNSNNNNNTTNHIDKRTRVPNDTNHK